MLRCARCGLRIPARAEQCPRDGAEVQSAANELTEPLPPKLTGYSFEGCLGFGGFGAVFAARRVADDAPVAVKVSHPEAAEAKERLTVEARALKELGKNLCPAVYEAGETDGIAFFVMERLNGAPLSQRLEQAGGGLELTRFRGITAELLTAVEAMHAAGWAHGDLKPENVFLEAEGAVRLIDLGSAQPASATAQTAAACDTDAVGPGTPEYMAPEQCNGSTVASPSADLYSLGVILYELLSGAPPFFGNSAEVREAHRSRRPLRPAGVPPEIIEVVMRCLVKDPAQRIRSVRELRLELERALDLVNQPRTVAADAKSTVGSESRDRKKRLLTVLHFLSTGPSDVGTALARVGGQLAYKNGQLTVAVFDHASSENPVRAALVAAQRCMAQSMFRTAIVDIANVQLQATRDGKTRYMSAVFAKQDRYPVADDEPGILLTPAAAEVVPELETTPYRGGLLRVAPVEQREETTVGRTKISFGRSAELAHLVKIAESAREAQRPAVGLVSAAAGHGKTHLSAELVAALEQKGFFVIRLRGLEQMLAGARATTQQMLRASASLPKEAPADGGRIAWNELIGPSLAEATWAAASLTLEWIADQHPEAMKIKAAPGALRNAVARIAAELLKRCAKQRPTALVLDAAQWADDASLDAIDLAATTDQDCPLSVFVFARPAFEIDRPQWCRRASVFRNLELGALDEAAARQLAQKLLEPAQDVPEWAIAQLVSRTQGVPGLLVELVRGLKQSGLIRRHEKGTGHYLVGEVLAKLPDMPILKWSTSREVESLPAELTAHAQLASVLGQPFETGDLDRLLTMLDREGGFEQAVLDAAVGIGRLVQAGLLVRRSNGLFDFRNALLREGVYESATDAFRMRVHRAAYELYAAQSNAPSLDVMSRLALHAARSGRSAEAAAWYERVADRAMERQMYQESAAVLDAALAQAEGDRTSTRRILHKRGLARFRVGRFQDSADDFARAVTLAAESGDVIAQAEDVLAEATAVDWMNQYQMSNDLLEDARRIFPKEAPAKLQAEMLLAEGRARHRAHEHAAASELLSKAVEKAEGLGDEGYEVFVVALLLLGFDAAITGRLEEGELSFARAVAAAEARNDQQHLAAALNNRISVWFARADMKNLLNDLERVLAIGKESGYFHIEGPVEGNIAEALYCAGDLEQAEHRARRALAAHARVGASVRVVNMSELLLARIALYRGDLETARGIVRGMEVRRARALEQNEVDLDLAGGDAIVFEGVRLTLAGASAEEWDKLLSSEAAAVLAPHERVDVLEMRASADMRAGKVEDALASLRAAELLARENAKIVAARVHHRLDAVGG